MWRLDIPGYHELVPSADVTLVSYYCRYIEIHDRIDFATNGTCQLRDVDMERIVDMAVKLALASLGQLNAEEKS